MEDAAQFMPDDDMNDKAEIDEYEKRDGLSRLARGLALCAHVIEPEFRAADARAMQAQKIYFRFAYWAAWLGSLATFVAILQLSRLGEGRLLAYSKWMGERLLPDSEVALAFLAVAVALAGLGGRRQQKWFLERYQAERLRLLKFHVLTRAALWPDHPTAPSDYDQHVAAEVTEIATSAYSALECWVSGGTTPSVLAAPQLTPAEWQEFRAYYQRKRLFKQAEYFVARMRRNLKKNDKTRIWPSVLFFGSVAFVLAHFFVDKVPGVGPEATMARLALLLAAALPAFGAVIRASRGVLEYARNASRCESTHHVLMKLEARLRDAGDCAAVCREIGFCEQVLESDLREWLRLMVESEWFG
jgi:hypothetical protein